MPFDGSLSTSHYQARREAAAKFIKTLPQRQLDLRLWGGPGLRRRSWLYTAIHKTSIEGKGCVLGWMATENFDGWHWEEITFSQVPVSRDGLAMFEGAAHYFGTDILHIRDMFVKTGYDVADAAQITREMICDKLLSLPFVPHPFVRLEETLTATPTLA